MKCQPFKTIGGVTTVIKAVERSENVAGHTQLDATIRVGLRGMTAAIENEG